MIQWMEMWLLRLNTTKCKAMTYGRGPGICQSYSISSDAVEKIWSMQVHGGFGIDWVFIGFCQRILSVFLLNVSGYQLAVALVIFICIFFAFRCT